MEIACDESGSEGEKLIGATTDVFAHASVQFSVESATDSMREIRARAPTPALEYKANHILRDRNRAALAWALGPSGPLSGNAHVHLTDKAFFVVGKVIDLLVEDAVPPARIGLRQGPRTTAMALTLYREGRRSFDRAPWQAFLTSSNDLLRARNRHTLQRSADAFLRVVDLLRRSEPPGPVDDILALLRETRSYDVLLTRLVGHHTTIPALDPLIPAIVRAVVHWSADGEPVSIVHDRQIALSDERIAQLEAMFDDPHPALLGYSPRGALAGLRLVDSRVDVRVQVADIMAGAARKIASDELNDRGDPELTALLRPYLDSFSIWGDDRSWSVMGPGSSVRS